jgi:hypothetical protein
MAVHLSRSCPSVERIAAGLCRTMNGLFWVRRGSLAALRGVGPEGSLACAVAGRRVRSGTERRHQQERRRGQSLQWIAVPCRAVPCQAGSSEDRTGYSPS